MNINRDRTNVHAIQQIDQKHENFSNYAVGYFNDSLHLPRHFCFTAKNSINISIVNAPLLTAWFVTCHKSARSNISQTH